MSLAVCVVLFVFCEAAADMAHTSWPNSRPVPAGGGAEGGAKGGAGGGLTRCGADTVFLVRAGGWAVIYRTIIDTCISTSVFAALLHTLDIST